MGYPYDSQSERFFAYASRYMPVRRGHVVPHEPAQTYLLGSRFADFGLAFAFALLIPVIRIILTRILYQPIGEGLMLREQKRSDVVLNGEKIRKWNESCWKMTVYTVLSTLAFLISYKEPWFNDPTYFWLGCTSFPPCNLFVKPKVLLFYCLQTGFYLQAIHYLAFIEVRRRDWLESMMHHVVTVGLLVYSYYVNFTRVGVMIMLVHDISDIFLEAAKLARYVRRQTLATAIFVVFFISWVVLRVLYFPLVIIRSTLFDAVEIVAKPNDIDPKWHHFTFNALLSVLFVLHLYWSYLILLIVIKAFSGGAKDIREEDD